MYFTDIRDLTWCWRQSQVTRSYVRKCG